MGLFLAKNRKYWRRHNPKIAGEWPGSQSEKKSELKLLSKKCWIIRFLPSLYVIILFKSTSSFSIVSKQIRGRGAEPFLGSIGSILLYVVPGAGQAQFGMLGWIFQSLLHISS